MAGEKVTRILKSRSHFAEEEIAKMTDPQGWAWLYANRPERNKTQICFTGFNTTEKKQLIAIAKNSDMHIAKSITKDLDFLCIGNNAGPAKLKKAKDQNVVIVTEKQFNNMIETGELPE